MLLPDTAEPLNCTEALDPGLELVVGPCQYKYAAVTGPYTPLTVSVPVPASRIPLKPAYLTSVFCTASDCVSVLACALPANASATREAMTGAGRRANAILERVGRPTVWAVCDPRKRPG